MSKKKLRKGAAAKLSGAERTGDYDTLSFARLRQSVIFLLFRLPELLFNFGCILCRSHLGGNESRSFNER